MLANWLGNSTGGGQLTGVEANADADANGAARRGTSRRIER